MQGPLVGLVLVALVVIVAYASTRGPGSGGEGGGGGGVTTATDGASWYPYCGEGSHLEVVSASYDVPPGAEVLCPTFDALPAMRAWAGRHPSGGVFTVAPTSFPGAPACPAPRQLDARWRCAPGAGGSAAGPDSFTPQRVNTCSDAQDMLPPDPDPAVHLWTGQNNRNFTVADVPWDPTSRIQLTGGALTPGSRRAFLPINPITRIGVTNRVPTWGNPYTPYGDPSGPCSRAVSLWDVQPGAPGFLEPALPDSTDGTPYQRRSYYQPAVWEWPAASPYGGPYRALGPGCPGGDAAGIGGDVAESKRTYIQPSPLYWLEGPMV
jgi:hypothetical protein